MGPVHVVWAGSCVVAVGLCGVWVVSLWERGWGGWGVVWGVFGGCVPRWWGGWGVVGGCVVVFGVGLYWLAWGWFGVVVGV